jgi:hypothetical protein
MSRICQLLVFAIFALSAAPGTNANTEDPKQKQATAERVGGDYRIESIQRHDDGTFTVMFQAIVPTGKFDRIRLDCAHLHLGVKEGDVLRISAEILTAAGAEAQASQVLVFVDTQQGPAPVWLLSNKVSTKELNGARYLEMHLPATDYMIF